MWFKAISLHQPWASAMEFGLKSNETRSRRINYRGDLVICATLKKPTVEQMAPIHSYAMSGPNQRDEAQRLKIAYPVLKDLPYGYALVIVEVYDCISTEKFTFQSGIKEPMKAGLKTILPHCEWTLGDYSSGRFAWLTRNPRMLKEPFPVKGHQGFFNIDIPRTYLPDSLKEAP